MWWGLHIRVIDRSYGVMCVPNRHSVPYVESYGPVMPNNVTMGFDKLLAPLLYQRCDDLMISFGDHYSLNYVIFIIAMQTRLISGAV